MALSFLGKNGTIGVVKTKVHNRERRNGLCGFYMHLVLLCLPDLRRYLQNAVFASLTSILGKVGIEGVNSNLGTAVRTIVVLIMAWIVVFVTGKQNTIKEIDKKELGFICLSGLATGGSWLCYYKALQDGLASVVVPIDKLSIVVTIAFSYIVFHEKLSRKALLGLVLIIGGTLWMVFL